MSGVAAADLSRALTLSREWHEARSLDEFIQVALGGLGRLVRADGVGWNEIDLVTGRNRFVGEPDGYMSDEDLVELDRLIGQHPIARYYAAGAAGNAVTISDFVGVRAYRRTELYTDLFRAHQIEDQIAVAIEAGGLVTGIAFSRDTRSFSVRDRTVLDLLRPHLVAAYANLRARAAAEARLAALEQALEDGSRGVAFARDGRVQPTSEGSARMLCRWFGDEAPPLPGPGRAIVVERPDARLTLSLANGGELLLLDEATFSPDPERARELGLNRRETEVLSLAARDLTDAAIAQELWISVRTVHKHLEHAYRKLGVHSRTDAVALLLGR